MKKWFIIVLFVIVIIIAIIFSPNDGFVKTGKLYINEVMAKNGKTIMDDDGDYTDYIEIYNGYGYDIDLEGYHLSDREYKSSKWTFPSITIKAKEYLIVYASGKNKCNLETRVCHTDFKLSSLGEKVLLIDKSANIISKVAFTKMNSDVSLSFTGNKYVYTNTGTPGYKNEFEEIKVLNKKDNTIIITEYLSHNEGIVYLEDGGYYDFIELYNKGDKDVNLKDLYLSDSKNNLNKFKLPDKVLSAHEYIVVYLTDGKQVEDYICATFKLSDNDDGVYLSNNGVIFDEVQIVLLKNNISYGLKDDKWYYFVSPTPGKENSTKGLEKLP